VFRTAAHPGDDEQPGTRAGAPPFAPATTNQLDGRVNGNVVQAGRIDKVEQHYHLAPPTEVSRRTFGIVPPRAGAFQDRDVAAELAGAAADGTAVLIGLGARILLGLGGVGKTQLAADHARALWSDSQVDVLMWVTATARASIVSAYARAAAAVIDTVEADAEQAAVRWLEWLASTDKRWLVVLDDVQDPADLHGLWPPHTASGQVVVTTRRRDASLSGDGRQIVEVGLFTPAESVAFLAQRLTTRPAQADGAAELARVLGNLPVALAQAAAYIANHTTLTCTTYLRRWTDRHNTLPTVLPRRGELPDQHQETLAATWSLSVDLADGLDPIGLARPLLEAASLLDPNGIPHTVFTAPATLTHLTRFAGREVDAEAVIDALSCLHRLSLITHTLDTPHRAVRVHALVQRATREALHARDAASLATAAHAVADAVVQVWPDVERDAGLSAVLRSNVAILQDSAGTALWEPDAHLALFRAGNSLGNTGQVHAAIDHFRLMNSIAGQRVRSDCPKTLTIRNNLAYWRGRAGDADGAVDALEHVLADCEQVLGADHPDTLDTRHNLAYWLGKAGDPAGAVAAFERLLADHERVSGSDHLATLNTRGDLARWRGEAGDVVGAVAAFEQLFADHTRVLAVDHADILATRHNLAYWLGKSGDPASAVTMFERLLADHERVLGSDHLATLTTRGNLSMCRGRTGDVMGAVAGWEQLLADHERLLGVDHPETLTTRHNLAYWRGMAGDPAGAVAGFEHVLADRERLLGVNHPDVLTTLNNLAFWRQQLQGQHKPGACP
jgi:tetratricopeptide (TPR) repeat protein